MRRVMLAAAVVALCASTAGAQIPTDVAECEAALRDAATRHCTPRMVNPDGCRAGNLKALNQFCYRNKIIQMPETNPIVRGAFWLCYDREQPMFGEVMLCFAEQLSALGNMERMIKAGGDRAEAVRRCLDASEPDVEAAEQCVRWQTPAD